MGGIEDPGTILPIVDDLSLSQPPYNILLCTQPPHLPNLFQLCPHGKSSTNMLNDNAQEIWPTHHCSHRFPDCRFICMIPCSYILLRGALNSHQSAPSWHWAAGRESWMQEEEKNWNKCTGDLLSAITRGSARCHWSDYESTWIEQYIRRTAQPPVL